MRALSFLAAASALSLIRRPVALIIGLARHPYLFHPFCSRSRWSASIRTIRAAVALASFIAVDIAGLSNAIAADSAAAPVNNWTGFYIGVNGGGGWGSRSVSFSPNDPMTTAFFTTLTGAPPSTSFTSSGALGGFQLGYDWQFNRNWLVGLETDFDWSGINGSGSSQGSVTGIYPFTSTIDEHIKWFGTLRVRLGYFPMDNLLTYVTGGFAYGRVEHSGSYVNNAIFGYALPSSGGYSFDCFSSSTCFAGASSSVATGWTAGAGLEYALLKNLSLKAEYLYVSLEDKSLTETALKVLVAGTSPLSFNVNYDRTSISVARIGLNYRFH